MTDPAITKIQVSIRMHVCNRYTYPLHAHTNELHPLVIPTTILSGFVAPLTYLPATRSTVLLLTPSAEPDQSAAGILSPPAVRMPPPLSARPRRLLLPAGRPCPYLLPARHQHRRRRRRHYSDGRTCPTLLRRDVSKLSHWGFSHVARTAANRNIAPNASFD